MPSDIIAITSPTVINLSDGTIEANFEGTEQVLVLGHCSCSSIRGVKIRRSGKVQRIYIRPDLDRQISLCEGDRPLLLVIMDGKNKNKIKLRYNAEERKWSIKEKK